MAASSCEGSENRAEASTRSLKVGDSTAYSAAQKRPVCAEERGWGELGRAGKTLAGVEPYCSPFTLFVSQLLSKFTFRKVRIAYVGSQSLFHSAHILHRESRPEEQFLGQNPVPPRSIWKGSRLVQPCFVKLFVFRTWVISSQGVEQELSNLSSLPGPPDTVLSQNIPEGSASCLKN